MRVETYRCEAQLILHVVFWLEFYNYLSNKTQRDNYSQSVESLYCLNVRGCEINRKLWVIITSIEKEVQGTAEILMIVAQVGRTLRLLFW